MKLFSETSNRTEINILKEVPAKIEYRSGSPAIAYMSGGKSFPQCLGCLNPSCMLLENSDVECIEVTDFPNDKSLNVCPVDAISWDERLNIPHIDSERCIRCGICIRRCPVAALYFDGTNICIQNNTSPLLSKAEVTAETIEKHNRQIAALKSIEKSGSIIQESNELLNEIYNKLFTIKSTSHNIIGRNLMVALGCKCAMRRIGDVYTRMDAIYSSIDGSFGAIEVEFGKDTLDASRGILDDVAVLYTRYGINKNANSPLVICLQLPNVRQGYWQVVKDIKTVEKIKIKTVTIGALMIMLWNNKHFMPLEEQFYLDYDNMDLRNQITSIIGRPILLQKKILGILEPEK